MAKKTYNKKKSISSRAGLVFSVGRISNLLRKGNYCDRFGKGAAIYITQALEYLIGRICESSIGIAKSNKRKVVIPRHIFLGIKNDNEINELVKKSHFNEGGGRGGGEEIETKIAKNKTRK